ncbi:MAG: diguanylate cyclase [Pyrinomonadaceae bacterium]|nr:diguanylate cyclase [Pyrinomonadaceae bacterium]
MSSSAHKNQDALDRLADENGVAVVVLDNNAAEIAAANNNSICRSLWRSEEFRPRCNEFCGKAFEKTHSSDEPFDYECHAGLACRAVAADDEAGPKVAIVGRTFLKAEGYRVAAEKAISGEWNRFSPAEFFENVLMGASAEPIRKAAEKIQNSIPAKANELLELAGEKNEIADQADLIARRAAELHTSGLQIDVPQPLQASARSRDEAVSAAIVRSLLGTLAGSDYVEACSLVLEQISENYGFDSLVWLEQFESGFRSIAALGELGDRPVTIRMRRDSERLLAAADRGDFVELKERVGGEHGGRKMLLFPARIGGEIRAALGIQAVPEMSRETSAIGRVVKAVSPQIEILRLRDEVSRSEAINEGVRRLGDSLKRIDSDDFWTQITRVTAELVRSERASLLIRDENTGKLTAKAAIGSAVDLRRTENVGSRIANRTFELGHSIVVPDIDAAGIGRAPGEWRYKTSSFISYPILIGERRLGVMNFTDRADGGSFAERDLEVLNTIAPQIAVAIDRGKLQVRAGELEKRSMTDSLTGLMNRGYIEERLIEEMNRASRYRFPMSLLMIDVDHFKSYNDSFGHPAGDVALRLVASVLKRTLRAADVAARYGGEEFAVLLPQTPVEQANWIAERIRQRVERTEFPKRQVTISVGVAGYANEFEDPKDWITAADMALYEAKELGRNCVIKYEDMGRSFREKIN